MSISAPALAGGPDYGVTGRANRILRLIAITTLAFAFSSLNVGALLTSLSTAATTAIPLNDAAAPTGTASFENARAADLTSQLVVAVASRHGDAVGIAQQRMSAMRRLLERAPGDVQQHLLTASTARQARALSADIERTVSLRGSFAQFHEDGPRGDHDRFALHTTGHTWRDGKVLDLFSSDPAAFAGLRSAETLAVTGVSFGNYLLVDKLAKVARRDGIFGAPNASAATTTTTGTIKTAVIALQLTDAPTPYNMTHLHNTFQDAAGHNVADYFKQASYGKAVIAPDFFGPFTLPSTITVAGGQCYDSQALEQAAYQAASASVTYANYSRIYFAINCRNTDGRGSGGSLGSVGEISISTPQGTVTAGQTFSFDTWGDLNIAAHELGHNFGFGHAQYYNCQPAAFTPPTRFGAQCATNTYADAFDLMGGKAWLAGNWDLAGHVNAAEKNMAGWFGTAGVARPATPGTYSYTVTPLEITSGGTQAVYVPRGSSGTGFWVEYRQPTGYDSWITDSTYCAACNVASGASIRFLDYSDTQTKLLDTTPYSQTANDQRDAALTAGRTFTDPEYGITVTTNSVSATGASITVTVPDTTACVRNAPGIAVAPTAQSAAPGQSVSYAVTLTDNDSATCSSNRFRTDPPTGLPFGITATSNLVTLTPGTSTTVNVTVDDRSATVLDSQTGYPFTVQTCGDYQSAACASFNLTFTQTSPADAQAPTTPGALTAQAVGSKQVNLSWSASTDNTAVVGYRIYRNGTQVAATHDTSYLDTAVAASTAYSYTVAAYDYKGNLSIATAAASVTTPAVTDTTAPSAPVGVNVAALDAHSVRVTWSPATDNSAVTRYTVSGGSGTFSLPATSTSYTDTGLAANSKYTFSVSAYDGAGNRATFNTSNTVAFTSKEGTTPPGRPSITSHAQVAPTRDDVFFSTSSSTSGPVSYHYFRDGREVGTSPVPAISDSHYPNDGAAHYDFVQAVDANGNISQSAQSNGWNIGAVGSPTDSTPPAASVSSPSSVSGTATASVTATDNVVVSGAELYLDGQLVGAAVANPYSGSASLTIDWDTNGWSGSHSLTAVAYDGTPANSVQSAPVAVSVAAGTTPAPPAPAADTSAPSIPTGVSATAMSGTRVDLSWAASTDNVGVTSYRVLRGGVTVATVGTTTSWSDTAVAEGSTYSYQVVAVDAAGNASAASAAVQVTTPPAPAPAAMTGAISGTVTGKGAPLSGATVSTTVNGSAASTKTAANGMYSFTGLPAGSYTLTFTAKGYTKHHATVTVVPGSTATLDMVM